MSKPKEQLCRCSMQKILIRGCSAAKGKICDTIAIEDKEKTRDPLDDIEITDIDLEVADWLAKHPMKS